MEQNRTESLEALLLAACDIDDLPRIEAIESALASLKEGERNR